MKHNWQKKVQEFCEKYNIPLYYLVDTMYEPKVVPMIRGKAFEFSVMMALEKMLPHNEWEVSKPILNAQIGLHDEDVRVKHKATNVAISVECKLAKKGGYRLFSDKHSEIRVKCMRSRTLGPGKIQELAPKLNIDKKVLAIHNDQYLPDDFDFIVTSIGNAFYVTDGETGKFEWNPSNEEQEFLKKLGYAGHMNLQDFAFQKMYIARTKDIYISRKNKIICTRGRCKNKKDCGFVPNYPIINFPAKGNKSVNGWVPIEESLDLFKHFVRR